MGVVFFSFRNVGQKKDIIMFGEWTLTYNYITHKLIHNKTFNIMKKTIKILTLLFSLAISSCGSDGEEGYENVSVKEKDSPTSTISEASKPFVGLWYLSTSGWSKESDFPPLYLFLSKDGRAWVMEREFNPTKFNLYHWNYNETTQILSTDHRFASWQINLISDESFSGLALWGKNTKPIYTAKFINDRTITYPAVIGTWVNKDKDTLRFNSSYYQYSQWYNNLNINVLGIYTHNKERYTLDTNLILPSEFLFDKEKELIKIVSGNGKTSIDYKEYEYWENLTIMNCFDFSNAYMDIDMCIRQEYADDKYVMVTKKGRYYRIKEQ